ncbi:putative E3 ubiquitin ligase [Handroanthus impetiginosus]|uniref:Putative E3 ubiquitin ligase n=1 Tax=Handroanthus impetiginosus TaxID=429701 RepID=A0A2G9I4X6_9LAMI|nr:putative E3 ubiquitin ligase [Handroanthus impetiginosus]
MAVEATHLNLFPKQLVQERDLMNPSNQGTMISSYNGQQMRFPAIPLSGNQSFYQPAVVCDSVQAKTESGLTYNIPAPRKRSRDSINQLYAPPNFPATQKNNSVSQFPSSVGENILPQIQQHHLEIDAIISQHTKKIRLELEERQKQHAKLLMAAIGEGVMKKLKEKDEQIQRMGKLNVALQERVKSLYVENQLWRDLAQANEATANSLRSNLEQLLAQVGGEEHISAGVGGGAAVEEEDVESCCGSSDQGRDIESGGAGAPYKVGERNSCYSDRRCKRCGERESCVLLLPCRHLCLCSVCGSGSQQLQACPVCNSSMNATLHVNMSS